MASKRASNLYTSKAMQRLAKAGEKFTDGRKEAAAGEKADDKTPAKKG